MNNDKIVEHAIQFLGGSSARFFAMDPQVTEILLSWDGYCEKTNVVSTIGLSNTKQIQLKLDSGEEVPVELLLGSEKDVSWTKDVLFKAIRELSGQTVEYNQTVHFLLLRKLLPHLDRLLLMNPGFFYSEYKPIQEGPTCAHWVCLVPISLNELTFIITNGMEEFIRKAKENQINLMNSTRESFL